MHDMTRVFWHGHNGSVFTLSGDLEVQGVVLRDVDGLVSALSRTIRGRSNARGGDVRGRVIEVMPGSLSVEILPNPAGHQSLPEVWELWCVLSTFYRPKEHGKTYHFSSNTRQKSTAG